MNEREIRRKKKIEEIEKILQQARIGRLNLADPVDLFILAEIVYKIKYNV